MILLGSGAKMGTINDRHLHLGYIDLKIDPFPIVSCRKVFGIHQAYTLTCNRCLVYEMRPIGLFASYFFLVYLLSIFLYIPACTDILRTYIYVVKITLLCGQRDYLQCAMNMTIK